MVFVVLAPDGGTDADLDGLLVALSVPVWDDGTDQAR